MMTTRKTLLATAVTIGLACSMAQPAAARAKIVFNDIGGVKGTPAELGFKIAASYWESVLTNNVTLHFNVGFDHLGANILGGATSQLISTSIGGYYDALIKKAATPLDASVLAHLSPLSSQGSVSALLPDYGNSTSLTGVATTGTRTAPDGKAISSNLFLTTANAQALGMGGSSVDATIQFSSDYAFDFNPINGIKAGESDFIGIAIHEIGHALGFDSGVDRLDYFAGWSRFRADDYTWAYAADLFRYSGADQLNWGFNQPSYFSIDGGATVFQGKDYFSTGEYYGDGWQASHWKADNMCGTYVGVMNPYTCPGQTDVVTASDLALMDAIGWNVNVDVLANGGYKFSTKDVAQAWVAAGGAVPDPVPEPGSWTMLLLGFGAIGSAMRYRTHRREVRFS